MILDLCPKRNMETEFFNETWKYFQVLHNLQKDFLVNHRSKPQFLGNSLPKKSDDFHYAFLRKHHFSSLKEFSFEKKVTFI
jgi:hypothetical protein